MNEARSYEFVQVDVFTTRRFGGNPLAVFLDGRGLSDEEMQSIALEMNLSETTFILPAEMSGNAARLRIFTTSRELPFAGHPTIGTTWVLANQGRTGDADDITLELGIGPISVTVQGPATNPEFLWMRQGEATFGPIVDDRAGVVSALGLSDGDLAPTLPIQPASTGLPFLYVPLANPEAVDRAEADARALPAIVSAAGDASGAFLLASEPGSNRAYTRMFATMGNAIWEDPATGSASGPLGAYLVQHGVTTGEGEVEIVSEQGTKMGRQSFVHIKVETVNGRPGAVQVGGSVVPVFEGKLTL